MSAPIVPMTLEAAVAELSALTDDDQEQAHVAADEIVCAFLRSAGAAKVADAFEAASARARFWYS